MKTAEIIGISRHRILRDGDGVTTLVGINGCPLFSKHPNLLLRDLDG